MARARRWLYPLQRAFPPAPAAGSGAIAAPGQAAPPAGFARGADVVELYHLRFEQVGESGLSTQVVQRVFRVENALGARELGVDDLWYDSSRNRFHLWQAGIYRAGRLIAQGRDAGHSGPDDAGSQSRQVVLPGLQAGDVVNIIYSLSPRWRSRWSMLDGKYLGDLFAFRGDYPVRQVRYVLESPAPLAVAQARLAPPRTWRRDGRYGWEWQSAWLPAFFSENDGPSITDRSPFVQASSFQNWQQLAAWYLQRLRSRSAIEPALRALWLRLAPPSLSPAAILERVRTVLAGRLRYQGEETGPHAFFPHSIADVWQTGRGDCKDGALLLSAWLRLEGIPADIAFLRTRRMGRLANGAATIAAFDHAIVYVPGSPRSSPLWIDTTAPQFQSATLPSSDQGALALILRPGQTQLVRVPLAAPKANLTLRRFQLRPDRRGGFYLRGSVQVSGADAPAWRTRCALTAGRRARLQSWLRDALPGAFLDSIQVHGLAPGTPAFHLRFRGWVAQLPHPLPLAWLRANYASTLAYTSSRQQRLRLALRWRTEDSWSLQLPRGCPSHLEIPQLSRVTAFGSLLVKARCRQGVLQISDSIAQTASDVPATDYPAFRRFWQTVDQELSAPVWPPMPRLAFAAPAAVPGPTPAR